MDNLPGDWDNFERISGIGDGIARQLHNSGIHRFSELALFTPQELAERVKDIVTIAPVQRIENDNWIGQARELAKKKLKPFAPKQLPPGEHELANFLVIFIETTNPEGETALKTIVNHEQTTQSKDWDRIATDDLIKWMLDTADLPGHPAAQKDRPASSERHVFLVPEDELEEEIELTLTDLWVSQAMAEEQADAPNPQKFVRVEGKLSIEGTDAHGLTYELVPFNIKFNLINMEGDRLNIVATYKGHLEPDKLMYEFQQDFPVPERGRYRLNLTARLLFPFTAEAQIQGPILRVGV